MRRLVVPWPVLVATAIGLVALTGVAAAAMFSSTSQPLPNTVGSPHTAAPTTTTTAPTTTTTVPVTAPPLEPSVAAQPTPAAPPMTAPTVAPCPTGQPVVGAVDLASYQDPPPEHGAGLVDGFWHTTVTGTITNHATAAVYVADISVLLHDPGTGMPVPTGGFPPLEPNGYPLAIAPGASVTWSSVGDVLTDARPTVTSTKIGMWAWADRQHLDCPRG